jgi:hypothetical protein
VPSVPSGTHVCAFFSGPTGRDDMVMPFLADGIRAGHKCICVLESLGPADVLARLDRQVDLGCSVETGQLELATPGDAYLRSGTFCTDDMLSYWQQAAAAAQGAKGSGVLRATGEMPSVLNHPDGRKEFFRYEARLTGVVASLPAVIFYLYDLQRFGAEVLGPGAVGAPQHAQVPPPAHPPGLRPRSRRARRPVQPSGRHPCVADPGGAPPILTCGDGLTVLPG